MGEVQLKFLIDKTMSKAIWARVMASKLATSTPPKTKTLKSIYLDTTEHALNKAGIALRLRRDGRRWIQSISAEGGPDHSQVGDVENAAPGGRICLEAIPDVSMRENVVRQLNGTPLQPVCETIIKRTESQLVLKDGTRAELTVDIGEIRAGEQTVELAEMEIELIAGSPAGIFDITRMLVPQGGARFSRLSMATRGYLLARDGHIDLPLSPRYANDVVLDANQTAEQAARDVLRECLDQIATNIAVVQHLDGPEGPHQLRIGLRRLRSVFSVFRSVLECPHMRRLSAEARWLGQEVGHLRDLDVVANDLVRPEAQLHPAEPGFEALAAILLTQAGERREALRATLGGSRVQDFLIDLARFVETRGWLAPLDFGQTGRLAAPVSTLAEEELSRRFRKVGKRASGLETLSVEERHELRKDLKKLRYAVEFFASLFSAKRIAQFLNRLRKLQTTFGDLNDAATLKSLFTGTEIAGNADGAAQRAMGWMIGASLTRAELSWTSAKALWRDLERTRPFWR